MFCVQIKSIIIMMIIIILREYFLNRKVDIENIEKYVNSQEIF